MLKFNEEQQIKDIRGALALRSDVEKVVDQVWTKGFDAVYYLGIGGTYASAMQAVTYANRSEERRVGKECRSRWSPYH